MFYNLCCGSGQLWQYLPVKKKKSVMLSLDVTIGSRTKQMYATLFI